MSNLISNAIFYEQEMFSEMSLIYEPSEVETVAKNDSQYGGRYVVNLIWNLIT